MRNTLTRFAISGTLAALAIPTLGVAQRVPPSNAQGEEVEPPRRVRALPPTIDGPANPEVVRRIVLRNLGHIARCHADALRQHAHLSGIVRIRFAIGLDGRTSHVAIVENTIPGAVVAACIRAAAEHWRFASPVGSVATVTYPFEFDGNAAVSPWLAQAMAAPDPPDEPVAFPSESPPEDPLRIGMLSASDGSVDLGETRQRIVTQSGTVRACFVAQPDAGVGAVAIRLTVGAGGIVSDVGVTEIFGFPPSIIDCVVQAAERWQLPPPTGGGHPGVSVRFVYSP